MRAFKLAAGLVIFALSGLVVSAMGIAGPYGGEKVGIFQIALSDPMTWLGLIGTFSVFTIITKVGGISVNLGTVVFAGLFAASTVPLNAVLMVFVNAGYLPSIGRVFFYFPYWMTMTFALIQLGSSPAEGGI